jgi:hypothetical protein
MQRHIRLSGLHILQAVISTGTNRYFIGFVVLAPRPCAGGMGVIVHYQVIADFTFTNGKPFLSALSLHSTLETCTLWPFSPPFAKFTANSRIFRTLQMAQSYIAHLKGVYPNSPAPFPVLDKGQSDLFSEVSE